MWINSALHGKNGLDMKKKLFFIVLLVVMTVVYIAFFDKSRFLWAGSFITPFLAWLVILVFYLTGGRGVVGKTIDGMKADYHCGPKMDEFDKCLQKRDGNLEQDSIDVRKLYENGAMDPETELFDYAMEKLRQKRQNEQLNDGKK